MSTCMRNVGVTGSLTEPSNIFRAFRPSHSYTPKRILRYCASDCSCSLVKFDLGIRRWGGMVVHTMGFDPCSNSVSLPASVDRRSGTDTLAVPRAIWP